MAKEPVGHAAGSKDEPVVDLYASAPDEAPDRMPPESPVQLTCTASMSVPDRPWSPVTTLPDGHDVEKCPEFEVTLWPNTAPAEASTPLTDPVASTGVQYTSRPAP